MLAVLGVLDGTEGRDDAGGTGTVDREGVVGRDEVPELESSELDGTELDGLGLDGLGPELDGAEPSPAAPSVELADTVPEAADELAPAFT